MTGITDLIVSFWFYPVTLFIVIPMILLCGWLLLRLTQPLFGKAGEVEKKEKLDEVEIITE